METNCCDQQCNQGRNCSLPQESVNARIASHLICLVMALLLIGILGVTQALDEHDAQTAVGQVMACSEHPKECAAFKQVKHESPVPNRRQ